MLTMYTTDWCGYCARLKFGLEREGITYDEVNIERVPDAADVVMEVNGGNQHRPDRGLPGRHGAHQPDRAADQGKARGLSPRWQPIAPELLPERLAAWLTGFTGVVRVAVDGPPWAAPGDVAATLIEPLRSRSRPAVHVPSSSFWRDASLRLEHGREDAESYRSWLDVDALHREVLAPVVERGSYLPSLRDPRSNRSTRAPAQPLAAGSIVLVSGPFLLGAALPFDRTIHLALSAATRARRATDDDAWTLPAFADYDESVQPISVADVVIRCDDPRHPAIRFAGG